MDGELLSRYEDSLELDYWWDLEEDPRNQMMLRNLKFGDEEEETTWKRFCVLPNINGQKYTIGKTFTSRDEQGEFIYLPSDTEITPRESSVAWEITVENDKFFVSCISPESAVVVNDVKIKTELQFGYKLSLGPNTFIFKERELNSETFLKFYSEEEEKMRSKLSKNPKSKNVAAFKGEFIPGQNGLIVSQILSYLSVEDLKSARFVSKLWSEEGFKILRKRVPLRLNYGFLEDGILMGSMMSLFRYSIEMADHSPMPYWKIFIPTFNHEVADTDDSDDDSDDDDEVYDTRYGPWKKRGAKLLEDLNFYIFDPNTRIRNLSVKRLELDGYIATKSDFELRLKLLQALGAGLEELTWGGEWNLDKAPLNSGYKFPSSIVFKKLRRFTLSLRPVVVVDDSDDEDDYDDRYNNVTVNDCSKFTWLKGLILAIRGATALGLNCSAPMAFTVLTQLHANKILKQFPNLNEITILRLTPAVINLFLNLDFIQPLKKLELFELKDMKKADFLPFEQLLLKHSQTLESLLFIIPPAEDEDLPPVFISFPIFPKLERLNVGWGPESYFETEDVKLTFSDGTTEVINYERDLPCLKSLTLWPLGFKKYPSQVDGETTVATEPKREWDYCGCFYEMFLPAIVKKEDNTEQEAETLQFLDIFHSVPTDGGEKPLFSKVKETAIASMFPKLETNSWINSIRKRDAAKIKANAKKVKTASQKKPENNTLGRLRSYSTRTLRPRFRPGGGCGNAKKITN